MPQQIPSADPKGDAEPNQKIGVKKFLGYFIGAACLVWVFHDIHMEKMLLQLGQISWTWIAMAVLCDIAAYVCQAIRWQLLLHPQGKLATVRTAQAVYAGLFANEILPLRVGELVRAFLVSQWLNVRLLAILPSMVVERLFDGIWLAIGLGITAMAMPLPQDLLHAADILGALVLFGTAAVIYLIVRKSEQKLKRETKHRLLTKFVHGFANFTAGIRSIGLTRHFIWSFSISSLVLIFQIFSFYLVIVAYHLHISIWAGAASMLIVHIGTALPNAPSNLGTYQFFTVVALTIFGIDKTTASGFSVVVFVILTLPLWAIGLVAVNQTGMSLRDIRQHIGAALKQDPHFRID
jgi:glycosyltransferase 2 family protein